MARLSKLDTKTVNSLCKKIEKGMPYTFACRMAGISYQTFLNWKARGQAEIDRVDANPQASIRKEELKYVEFLDKVWKSEAKAVETNLKRIGDAADNGSWQAAAFILKCRHPDEFTESQKVDAKVEHSGGVSIKLDMRDFSKKDE